ncbi:MAG: hypothetical protein K6C98_08130 [Treponema sp.]|nr:hypothetical protein [Treponema sp.]
MYKKLIKILVLFAVCLAASACKVAPDEDATYKVETGEVENSVYDISEAMKKSYNNKYNFRNIKILRDYLFEMTPFISYNGVKLSDATKDDIQQYLLELAPESTSYIDAQIAFLVSNGNTLLYFSSETSESMKRWVYIQKE